jgi:acyl carrier protein
MSNREKYEQAFMECFSIGKDMLNDKLLYQSVPTWDSVGHMTLIGALESAFDIQMEMDDIIDFASFDKGIETLSKYKITI